MKKSSKIILTLFIIISLGILGVFGYIYYFMTFVDYRYTGKELFDIVNKYRASQNIPTIELDTALCNNLVERWIAVKTPDNGHKGFEEWVVKEKLRETNRYQQIGEIYVSGVSTPTNAINWWLGSPGHRATLEMVDMKYGCAYANGGTGVVIMATAKK